jgi:tight adherence protein C
MQEQEIILGILIFLVVIGLGGAIIAFHAGRRSRLTAQIRGEAASETPATRSRAASALVGTVGSIGERMGASRGSDRLRAELIRAGFHSANALTVYMGAKVVLGIVGAALTVTLTLLLWPDCSLLNLMLLTVIFAGALFFVPNVSVAGRARRRSEEVHEHLPDAMDLLEICVSSGMGMDAAWNAVAHEMRFVSPVLADEMALTNLETHLGVPHATAFRHMADRTRDQDISSFVAIVIQAERFGTSVSAALETFAKSMRDVRSQRAEERAEKIAVKLILPMTVFFFPVLLIIVVGPAGMTLVKVLGT